MNILIFSRSYSGIAGGVEKVSIDLAGGLFSRGYTVSIVSFDQPLSNSFFRWPIGVNWIRIPIGEANQRNSFRIRLQRLVSLRSILRSQDFDVAVAFQIGSFLPLRIASLGLKTKVIAAERNSPDLFSYIRKGKVKHILANQSLRFAHKVAIQFEEYSKLYPSYLRGKLVVTPNWVQQKHGVIHDKINETIQILYIGRLSFQKNVQVLLAAMDLLPDQYKLTIIGEGSDLIEIERITARSRNKVKLISNKQNLKPYYVKSNVFCLPSRWEGFPNVLAEALSYGIPIVGFADCSGVKELVQDGINGYKADGMGDPKTLAAAIIKVVDLDLDPNVIKATVEDYTFEKFLDYWELVIN